MSVTRDDGRKRIHLRQCCILGVAASFCAAIPAWGGPPGDYGDAPVGDTTQGILAYPGVLARWTTNYQHTNTVASPVQHNNGTWLNPGATFFLGDVPPPVNLDSLLNPGSPDNDAFPQIVVDNLGPIPRAEVRLRVSTSSTHTGATFYLNMFIDQNRDGQWKDGYYLGTPLAAWVPEWQIADYPINVAQAGQAVDLILSPIALADPLNPVWVRTIVSDTPIGTILKAGAAFWDTTMPQTHGYKGEIEDVYLGYNPNPPPAGRSPGVWLRQIYYSGPVGQPGQRRPACDVRFTGPKEIGLVACPAITPIPLDFQVTDLLGGCANADVLIGIYGIAPIKGGPGPQVNLNAAGLPAGSNFGPAGPAIVTCPNGPPNLALPAAVQGFGRLWQGTVPASLLAPRLNILDGCYADPPKVSRRWRIFVETQTCGSDHRGLTVANKPRLPQNTAAAAAISTLGGSGGHVDLLYPGAEEPFDRPPDLPFPSPDFANYQFLLNTPPFSAAGLSVEQSHSPPTSLRLIDASYFAFGPGSDPFFRTDTVTFWYYSEVLGVNLTSADGLLIHEDLPILPGVWQQHAVTLPPGFELGTIEIAGGDGWIDDIELVQSPRPPKPPENDSWTMPIPIGIGRDGGTTVGATPDGSAPCDPTDAPADVWFSFTPNAPLVTIDTDGSAVPTILSVHPTADSGPGPALACSSIDPTLGTPHTVVPVLPGETYLIRVATPLAGEVSVHLDEPLPPPNINCETAVPVQEGVYPFNTALAPSDGVGPIECFDPGSEPFSGWCWWRFVASVTGEATVDTCAADVTPASLEVYPGGACPIPGTRPVRCNIGGCGHQATVSFPTIAGHAYFVRLGGPEDPANRGRGVLTISSRPTCRADFNNSGAASVQDIFDFLAAYFAGDPRADFNLSGAISVQDIFDFLAVYFEGCN